METFKLCNTCNQSKLITEFGLRKDSTDGHKGKCKVCEHEYKKEWSVKNKDRIVKEKKIYREKHKERITKNNRLAYHQNKEKYDIVKKKYYESNKEKVKEYQATYYQENKDKANQSSKRFYEDNKDRMLYIQKLAYLENKDYILKRNKDYQVKNKDKVRACRKEWASSKSGKIAKKVSSHLRNTKMRITNDNTITKTSLALLLSKQNDKCYYCGTHLDFNIKFSVHLDHYIPISKGGAHSIDNVVFSCKMCNLKKSDSMPETFL